MSAEVIKVCVKCNKAYIVSEDDEFCPECADLLAFDSCGSPEEWEQLSEEQKQEKINAAIYEYEIFMGIREREIEAKEPELSEEVVTPNLQFSFVLEKNVTTTDGFHGKEIDSYLGTVSGTDVYLVGGLLGGGLMNQENLFTNAFENAKHKMMLKAGQKGADGIVGMTTNVFSPGNLNNIIVVVTGTAVKIKEEPNDLETD